MYLEKVGLVWSGVSPQHPPPSRSARACPSKVLRPLAGEIGSCHRFVESVVENSSRGACSEKKSVVQKNIAAPHEQILATVGERAKPHVLRAQIQKSESDHRSQFRLRLRESRDYAEGIYRKEYDYSK